MKHKLAICWDLDETLGVFRSERIHVTEKIVEVLKKLRKIGFAHFITTSANRAHVDCVLGETGLRTHFSHCFSREDGVKPVFFAKNYGMVVEALGWRDKSDAHGKMVIIGDQWCDRPMDVRGTVFLQDEFHAFRATIIEKILCCLLDRGRGNLVTGFQDVYESGETYPFRTFALGNNPKPRQALITRYIRCLVGQTFKNALFKDPFDVPTLTSIQAESYRSNNPDLALRSPRFM